MEGQIFKKLSNLGLIWLEMDAEASLFIHLSGYITFMTRARVQQS